MKEQLYLTKRSFIENEEVIALGVLGDGLSVWESVCLNKIYIIDEMDNVICYFYSDEKIDCNILLKQSK